MIAGWSGRPGEYQPLSSLRVRLLSVRCLVGLNTTKHVEYQPGTCVHRIFVPTRSAAGGGGGDGSVDVKMLAEQNVKLKEALKRLHTHSVAEKTDVSTPSTPKLWDQGSCS